MRWFRVALIGVLPVAVVAVLARRMLFVVRVDGDSMLPTYRPEDALLAVRAGRSRAARRGDVVVFALPAEIAGPPGYLVKRVIAVAGEPVPGGEIGELVEPGRLFLQGDAVSSYDSRAFGTIAVDRLRGRAIARLSRRPAPGGGR